MTSRGEKGVVLAAGLGTRLKPLTERWPKPLVPFCGTTPLLLALRRLHQAGIADIAVNTHYLGDQVQAALMARPFGLSPRVSHEKEILGTGGVYNPLRDWQGSADLVVINGDVVSDIDVESVVAVHRQSDAVATMALLPEVLPGESAVFFEDGRVVAIGKSGPGGAQRGNFACVQILSRSFVDLLPSTGSFDVISQGYQKALEAGMRVAALVHRGIWHDIGSVQRYAAGVFDVLTRQGGLAALGIDPRGVTVTPEGGVIEDGAEVGAGAVVERSIVLPGGKVAAGEHVKSLIIASTGRISFV
jgi:mannose-1-phosphate guanylyltransferase